MEQGRKKDNYDEYRESVIKFFKTVGIEPSVDTVMSEKNESGWKDTYERGFQWVEGGISVGLIDVEIRGKETENIERKVPYANLYFRPITSPMGIRQYLVCPGICSFPMDKNIDADNDNSLRRQVPVKDYYLGMECVIGIDIFSNLTEFNEELRNLTERNLDEHYFLTDGRTYAKIESNVITTQQMVDMSKK